MAEFACGGSYPSHDTNSDEDRLARLLELFVQNSWASQDYEYSSSGLRNIPQAIKDLEWLRAYRDRRVLLCEKFWWKTFRTNYRQGLELKKCIEEDLISSHLIVYEPSDKIGKKSAVQAYLKNVVATEIRGQIKQYISAIFSKRDEKELDQLFRLPLQQYHRLITGEWENAMLSKLMASDRISSAFQARRKQTAFAEQHYSVFRPYHGFVIGENKAINFYNRPDRTVEDAYRSVFYEISHRLLFDPLATLVIDPESKNPQFHGHNIRLSEQQVKALHDYAKTNKGKALLEEDKNSLLYYVCKEGWDYYTGDYYIEEGSLRYPSMRNLVTSLEKEWNHILCDARYAALCLLSMTPEDKSVEERVDIVFGDHSPDTLKKTLALLSLPRPNTGAFFFINEINAYLQNRSSQEVLAVNAWTFGMRKVWPEALSLLKKCPEAVLIDARNQRKEWQESAVSEYGLMDFPDYLEACCTLDEDFFKKHGKEIREIRYGNYAIANREHFIRTIPGLMDDTAHIVNGDWAKELKKGIKKILKLNKNPSKNKVLKKPVVR